MEYKKQLVWYKPSIIANTAFITFVITFALSASINIFLAKKPLLITGKVYWDIIFTVALLALFVFVHELVHALGAIAIGKCKRKDISLGFNFKQIVFYCHIKKPISIGAYKAVLILPIILTGILPLILSAFFGNIFLTLLFSFMTAGGMGDIIMFFGLSGYDKKVLVQDHGKAFAYYLLFEEGQVPENFTQCVLEDEIKLEEEMKKSPFASEEGIKKSPLLKALLIAIFCSLSVLGIFIAALIIKIN